jgi:hypothetical protein
MLFWLSLGKLFTHKEKTLNNQIKMEYKMKIELTSWWLLINVIRNHE